MKFSDPRDVPKNSLMFRFYIRMPLNVFNIHVSQPLERYLVWNISMPLRLVTVSCRQIDALKGVLYQSV